MATTDPYLQYLQDYNAGITTPTTGGLQDKLQEKIQNTKIKKATLLGLDDADTPLIEGIGELRETPIGLPTNARYDAVELQHGSSPYNMYGSTDPEDTNKKSIFAMATQRAQASRLLGIPENKLTQQDMIDVGNQQQIQKLADLVRSPEEQRWEAPLIRGAVQTNLTGKYIDEFGKPVDVPLNIPIGVELTGESDIYGRKLGSVFNAETGENTTNIAATDRSQNAFAKASQKDIAAALSAGLNKAAEPTFIEEMSSLPGAVVSGVVKGGLGTADFVTDLGQRAVNKGFGTNFSGGLMEEDTITKIADTLSFGYDAAQDASSMQKASDSWSVAFKGVDITKPSTYKNVLDVESAKATGNALLEYAKNPSLAAESLGQLAVGFGTKAVGQKIAQKAIEKYGSDTLKETMKSSAKAYDELAVLKANTTMDAIEKAEKVGEVTKKIDTLSKIGKTVSDAIPAVSYAASITNQQMAEFKDNNNGVEMSTDRVLGTLVANTLAFALPEIAATKVALGLNPAVNKAISDNVSGAVSKAFTTLAVGGITEVPQELVEGVVETVSTRLGTEKYKDKTVEEIVGEATSEIVGNALGGGVGGIHMATPTATKDFAGAVFKGPDREKLQAELDELKSKTAVEVRSNLEENLDLTANVELSEVDSKLEEDLGVPSVNGIVNTVDNVDDLLSTLNETKAKIVGEAFEVEVTPTGETRIVGIKDINKAEAATAWLEDYKSLQSNKEGKVPQAVEEEVNYVKNTLESLKDSAEQLRTAQTSIVEDMAANKVKKDLGDVSGKSEIDVKAEVEAQIDRLIEENKEFSTVPNIKESVTKKVLDTYGISGMSGLGNVGVELSKEEMNDWATQNAGIKTNLEGRATPTDGKVVETGSVTNEELDAVMEGEGTIYDSSHPNTKLRERVLRHLDPLTNKGGTVNVLRSIKSAIMPTIERNQEKAGRFFKGGDVAGNMMRLMVVAANTINGQVASDTNMRAGVELDDSMTMKNEYWASVSSTQEQIGKDYASSYGLKLTGSPEELSKVHRALGRFAIELLEDAGLVELTKDTMRNRAGDVATTEGGKLASSPVKKGVGTIKTKDSLTGKEVLMTDDRGIRLVDTVQRVDPLDESKSINKYKSSIGDALGRVSKLLLPNANRVPTTEYVDRDLKIDPDIKVNKDTVEAVKNNMAKPVTMKTGMVSKVLEHLKAVNETTGLNSVEAGSRIKEFLGLVGTGAKLLEVNEDGKLMNRMNNILGILDNLDVLSNPDGVYYHFQIDINNRTTLQEDVGNYQGDKDYTRPIMGVGSYTAKTAAEKEILVADLVDALASKEQKESMTNEDILAYYKNLLDSLESMTKGDIGAIIQVLADSMEPGRPFAHLKTKGGLRILSALEGARDVVNAGEGPVTTEYLPEKDASASGVQNNLLNICGRTPELFKDMLRKLGVKFDGEVWPEDLTDAYSFLSAKIQEALNNLTDNVGSGGLAQVGGSDNLEAVRRIQETLKDKKLMRELAKYPIMTWFYSAERDSIVENLTQEVTQVLIEKAVAGDENVLKYLSDVIGKPVTKESVKEIERGSKEHLALRKELSKIGDAFHSKLATAFPQVEENKKEMQEHFNFLNREIKALKTLTGKDYWNGKIRTALGALKGTNDTMSLYKQKNTAMDLSSEEKMSLGIATEAEKTWLVTKQQKLANVTSMLALMMHSVDSAQQAIMLEKIKNAKAILTIHDGFKARPEDLIKAQKILEEVTIELALSYDIMNETAVMMRTTAQTIKDDLENLSTKERAEAESTIKRLENKAEAIEKVNNPRMKAKTELLKNAQTQMFGKEGYIGVESKTEAETVSTPEEVRAETVKRVYENVLDMIEELPTMDERKFEILGSDVKMVTLNEGSKKELLKSTRNLTERKSLKDKLEAGGSFTFKGTVYIDSKLLAGIDEVSGKEATTEQVLDTVMHEIEHAIVDQFVDSEKDGQIKSEYSKLLQILKLAEKGKIPTLGRPNKRVAYVMGLARAGNYDQAVKELIAISREEEVAGAVFNQINRMAGIQGNPLSTFIRSIWNKIQELMKTRTLEELLDASDVYTVAVAVQSIQNKARSSEGLAKVDNGTIRNTEVTPFDVSEFTSKIETIC